ncbi:MAG: hypothetical protein OCC46_13620 [Pseudodesulfovibrio sp.]
MKPMPSVILTDFCPVQLSPPISQEKFIESLAQMMIRARLATHPAKDAQEEAATAASIRETVEKFAVSPDYIAARELNAVIPGKLISETGKDSILSTFPDIDNLPKGHPIDVRMAENDQLLDQVFAKAYAGVEEAPGDLVHVTSGGYSAPSPPQRFLAENGWLDTVVAHVYHMGCFGAFPAVRSAAGALLTSQLLEPNNPKKRADVLHSEYFSLHVNLSAQGPEDIISFTLFGDGFIKYSAVLESEYAPAQGGLKVIAMQDTILPDTAGEMTWHLHTHQFALHLAKSVPYHIQNNCLPFAKALCAKAGIDFEAEKDTMAYAIHTGGPKILDFVEEQFGIQPEKIAHSKDLLLERGNMSSAACPHIWERIVRDDTIEKGTKVLSVGFGPGLTVAGMIMEKV